MTVNEKCRLIRCMIVVAALLVTAAGMPGCHSSPSRDTAQSNSSPATASSARNTASETGELPLLADSEDRLIRSFEKPVSPFHLSFKKEQSDGYSWQYEADISSAGITGQQTAISPETRLDNNVVPAKNDVQPLNGTPMGSPPWRASAMGIATVMGMDIHYGQPGLKYVGDEQTGGYDARRYDFDLASVPAKEKSGVLGGSNALGGMTGVGGGRRLTDYNVKGSAWIAKDDGRLVKFVFDYIMLFSDGDKTTTHYDGSVSKKG